MGLGSPKAWGRFTAKRGVASTTSGELHTFCKGTNERGATDRGKLLGKKWRLLLGGGDTELGRSAVCWGVSKK